MPNSITKHPTMINILDVTQVSTQLASLSDEGFLFALYSASRKAELSTWGWTETQQEAFLQMQFRAQQGQYHSYPAPFHEIILYQQQPVGHILTSQLNGQIRLVEIAILPNYRYKGIGTLLLKKMLATAETRQQSVSLHVAIDNPARALYERLGFQIKDTVPPYYLMEWNPITPLGDTPHA